MPAQEGSSADRRFCVHPARVYCLRFLCCVVVGTIPATLACATSDSPRVSSKPVTCEIHLSCSPSFGVARAEAVREILSRELVGAATADSVRPVLPVRWLPSRTGSACSLLGALAIVVLGLCVWWQADMRRAAKYDPQTGRLLLRWPLAKGLTAAFASGFALVGFTGLLNATLFPGPFTVSGPAGGDRLAVVVHRPEIADHDSTESVVTCVRQSNIPADTAKRIARILRGYGIREIRVIPPESDAADMNGEGDLLIVHLQDAPRFELTVRHMPRLDVDAILDNPDPNSRDFRVDERLEDNTLRHCTISYPESNPLAHVACEHLRDLLSLKGFTPSVRGVLANDSLDRIEAALWRPDGTVFRLHHPPGQDVADLVQALGAEGLLVESLPSRQPPIPPGILYYPTSSDASGTLEAQEQAGRYLKLINTLRAPGADSQVAEVFLARGPGQAYELNVTPVASSFRVKINGDADSNSILRPIVNRRLQSKPLGIELQFGTSSGNPADDGVIRCVREEDRVLAARLKVALTELVGLEGLEIAPTLEPQLDEITVQLSYETQGRFHAFVERFLGCIELGERDQLKACYTERGWAQDSASQTESTGSPKVVPLREKNFDDDWLTRYICPGVFHLETIRLQEDLPGSCSVVWAQRTLICRNGPAGLLIDAVTEEQQQRAAARNQIPRQFTVYVVGEEPGIGTGSKIRTALKQFGANVKFDRSPPEPTAGTIAYSENDPRGFFVARMAQAILEQNGEYFSLISYPGSANAEVYVIVSTVKGG